MYDAETTHAPLVLVVDPAGGAIDRARETLESEGFRVEGAGGCEEGAERFDALAPDLVLIDTTHADLGGVTLCGELRRRRANELTPVVAIVDGEDLAAIDAAYQAGATDFIAKPIHWKLLCRRVRYLLRANELSASLHRNKTSMANAQRIARIGSWELNTKTKEMYWTDEIYRIFGLQPGSLRPTHLEFWNRVHPNDREVAKSKAEEALQVSKSYSVEHRIVLPDGRERHVQHHAEISEEMGPEAWLIGTLQDVSEQKAAQERILHLASYDSLTGLANRHLFLERLERATSTAQNHNQLVGLLYLDLDKFKRINDTLGHAAGDAMLQRVAEVLLEHVRGNDVVCRVERDVDPEVSRLGGDEFTILLSRINSPADAGDVARRICEALPTPITIEGHEISPTGSIGIAVYPMDGADGDTLLKNADTAMYHAKELGRNNFQFYNASMNKASIRKLSLEANLRRALENTADSGLALAYQPRVDVATRQVLGLEALLRWDHPELGKIPPRELVPLAEETGLIVPIGRWVMRRACRQAKEWQDQGYEPITISVNVSSRQFIHHDLRDTIGHALQDSGLDPSYLEIEITESLLMQDDENTALVLRDLRAMGVRVALDDFGTGYSSLSYITRFPLDTLKMDRCFVRDVDSDPNASGIAKAVIERAHSLGARVVAEGVDAEEQATVLLEHGCDEL
ncbi:MAG: EAL domain-containing protein, partial [Proteobacteria bacterium]|nr:EAL domain-containing protein [Pseudomonadota bacterium]